MLARLACWLLGRWLPEPHDLWGDVDLAAEGDAALEDFRNWLLRHQVTQEIRPEP